MADAIGGPVTDVVDGDTFDMDVTYRGEKNTEKYNDKERVRIAGINAPEIGTEGGKKAKKELEKKISDKEVRCTVRARDTYGRIVADIKIL